MGSNYKPRQLTSCIKMRFQSKLLLLSSGYILVKICHTGYFRIYIAGYQFHLLRFLVVFRGFLAFPLSLFRQKTTKLARTSFTTLLIQCLLIILIF